MLSLLLGGIGLFLLGMWLMTEGLKLAAGDTLQKVLRSATSSPLRGLAAGGLITAVVQSSSAVTVATIGFVNAGLLDLAQSIWVVFGTNVGTTMTGWLVAAVGVKVDVVALALPLIGAGMLIRLAMQARPRLAGIGQAMAGFGAFFLGIGMLQQGFSGLTLPSGLLDAGQARLVAISAFLLVGVALTVLTQSSSAAIAIILTASAGAGIPLEMAAVAVIGTNVGTTSTAALAAIAATPPARRVAGAHIAFNILAACVALALLGWFLAASRWLLSLAGNTDDTALALAIFHTLFNLAGVLLVWPIAPRLTAWLERRFVSLDEKIGRPVHLDATLRPVPALALRGLVLEATRMADIAYEVASTRIAGGAADRGQFARQQAGVMRLGRAIRDFIGEMNKSAMPAEVADALPDVIRGVQHIEETAQLSAEYERQWASSARSARAPAIEPLRHLVLESLRALHPGDEEEARRVLGLQGEIEEGYQRLKAELLREAAIGRLPVEEMEATLFGIRLMRRCAEAARKTQGRLGRLRRREDIG